MNSEVKASRGFCEMHAAFATTKLNYYGTFLLTDFGLQDDCFMWLLIVTKCQHSVSQGSHCLQRVC